MDWKNRLLQIGFKISFGSKKMFDPYYQERTSANEDLLKKDEEKTKTMLDKMFGINKGGRNERKRTKKRNVRTHKRGK